MQKKQVFNPFLPLNEYIPDGEPHVFGDRVYHYGSHDKEGGYTFCMEDYVVYSAPVDDLSDWRYEGVSYKASQDPVYPDLKYMYAPDVVKGNDGKYYLYYCMGGDYGYGGYSGHISVAVSDKPAGPFEYLGFVRNKDGSKMMKYICFDPAVINDDGIIRLYYGTQYGYEEDYPGDEKYIEEEVGMFGRTREEILSYEDSINGPNVVVLEDDMLTVKEEAKHIIPYKIKGTSFEGHPFFEGASMRKVGDKYYFVYSSWLNHELCYATSDYPDRGFTFGGTIVSNGDVGLNGRESKDRLNMTGTTHGSIVDINGQWYVFYHRLTHKSDYSRQACAEKIYIEADGSIKQVEITSCGLNEGPLKGDGEYPAVIACNLTNGHMPHGSNSVYAFHFPNVTNKGDERFIGEIEDGTLIGYKHFDYAGVKSLSLYARIENEDNKAVFDIPLRVDERSFEDGSLKEEDLEVKEEIKAAGAKDAYFDVLLDLDSEPIARVDLDLDAATNWTWFSADISVSSGVHPLYLVYHGSERVQLMSFKFN